MPSNSNDKEKLNKDTIIAAAKDYALCTGMECLVLFPQKGQMFNPCSGVFHEELCHCLSDDIGKCCLNVHTEGAINARNGSVYYCPMGLMHWAAPVIIDGKIEAALIAGHTFLNHSPEEPARLKVLSSAHAGLLKDYPKLRETLLQSPVITEERLESLKRMLNLLAESLSDQSEEEETYSDIREAFIKNNDTAKLPRGKAPWETLLDTMETGSADEAKKAADNFAAFIGKAENPERARAALAGFVLSLYDRSLEKDGQNFLGDRCLNALNDLERLKTVPELSQWAAENLRSLQEAGTILPGLKNANMIYTALQYIDDHYSDRFSLQDIADAVHFSAPYFSKIFKRETGINFTKYLTSVRIEKSKQLLINTDCPLADIPELVGFEEQSYFSRVFRSATGISPGKYREQNTMSVIS